MKKYIVTITEQKPKRKNTRNYWLRMDKEFEETFEQFYHTNYDYLSKSEFIRRCIESYINDYNEWESEIMKPLPPVEERWFKNKDL